MHSDRFRTWLLRFRRSSSGLSAWLIAGLLALPFPVLTGCGLGVVDSSSSGELHLSGSVHGGQQPVVGSQILLYAVGRTGNASPATSLLTVPVYSSQGGSFSITGDYTCPSAATQIYIVAQGGNPGVSSNNSAITMVAALGSCGTLLANAATTFITVNEVTTAAAAWALGAFASSAANVGGSATNAAGMANAMGHAALLANSTTGLAASTSGQTIETAKLYALADALATCVNSTGSACSGLFTAATPPGGSAPTDTFTAALNIVHYPANNVAGVFNQVGSTPPFPTSLTAAPHDWTMSDTIALPAGSGTAAPMQIAIDGTGTAWTVDNRNSLLYALTPRGTLLSATGYGAGYLTSPVGVTVNAAGNVWVADGYNTSVNNGTGDLLKFQSTTGTTPGALYRTGVNGTPYFYDANTIGPFYLAADSPTTAGNSATGNIVLSSFFGGSYTQVLNDAGTVLTATGLGGGPQNAVFDSNHGLWIPDYQGNDVIHVTGATNTSVTCCNLLQNGGLGLDSAGNLWINDNAGVVSEVAHANNVLVAGANIPYILSPAVTGDAGAVVWFANQGNNSVAAVSSGTAASGKGSAAAGTLVSPSGGFGLDAALGKPGWIVPDASGSLWVTDSTKGTVVRFFGLATPTQTPQLAVPTAP